MLQKLYTGPIKTASTRLGLHPYLVRAYRIGNDPVGFYRLKTTETYRTEVKGIDAEFGVQTLAELRRVERIARNEELHRILDEIETDDVYWDVGANIGTHTVFPAKAASDGDVVSVEPFPKNVESLERNVRLNDLENVCVEEVALGTEETTMSLNVEGGTAGSGGHSIVTDEGNDYVDVPVIRGDSLLETHESPDVIKIDVQAAELEVLSGLTETLRSCRVVLCEAHRRRGVDVEKVTEFFDDRGFRVETLRDTGHTAQLIAKKASRF